MLFYWLIFGFVAYMAIVRRQTFQPYSVEINYSSSKRRGSGWFDLTLIFLVLAIGLRFEVGGDWGNYLPAIERAKWNTLAESL